MDPGGFLGCATAVEALDDSFSALSTEGLGFVGVVEQVLEFRRQVGGVTRFVEQAASGGFDQLGEYAETGLDDGRAAGH